MTEPITASIQEIDRRSFILGMITAFSECVANECKKAALSPPFYPGDLKSIQAEAERIAREQGVSLWFERNPDIPEASRLYWFVLYKYPEVIDEYRAIREQGYNPVWRIDRFHAVLSYGTVWGKGADKVVPQIRSKAEGDFDTVARVLLKIGDWPVPRP